MNLLRHALEDLHRADVLRRLATGAAQGDVAAFLGAASQLTWVGGWADALRALVALGTVPGAIQTAFRDAWEASASDALGLKRTLTLDLLCQDRLLLDGLALLLPAPAGPTPVVLYRAQGMRDYRAGRVGCWWTPYREHAAALWLATSAPVEHVGDWVLLEAQAQPGAIIHGTADDIEVVPDPSRLAVIRVVGVVGVRQGDPDAVNFAA